MGGLDIAQFPISLMRAQLEDGGLVQVREAYSPAGVDIYLLWPKRAQLSPRVRYIVDELLPVRSGGVFVLTRAAKALRPKSICIERLHA